MDNISMDSSSIKDLPYPTDVCIQTLRQHLNCIASSRYYMTGTAPLPIIDIYTDWKKHQTLKQQEADQQETSDANNVHVDIEQETLESQTFSFPLDNESLQQLLSYCSNSPFGHITETKEDDSIRKSKEISHIYYAARNDDNDDYNTLDWQTLVCDSKQSLLLSKIREKMVPHTSRIYAQPHKLLVYEQGDFFSNHRDTAKSNNHFGTLIFFLPSTYAGGKFILKHNNEIKSFVTGQIIAEHTLDDDIAYPEEYADEYDGRFIADVDCKECEWLAFFTDCEHEVKPVLSGSRITLTYNLYYELNDTASQHGDTTNIPEATSDSAVSSSLTSLHDPPLSTIFSLLMQCNTLPKELNNIITEYSCINLIDIIFTCPDFPGNNKADVERQLSSWEDEVYQFFHPPRKCNSIGMLLDHSYAYSAVKQLQLKGKDLVLYNSIIDTVGKDRVRVVPVRVFATGSADTYDYGRVRYNSTQINHVLYEQGLSFEISEIVLDETGEEYIGPNAAELDAIARKKQRREEMKSNGEIKPGDWNWSSDSDEDDAENADIDDITLGDNGHWNNDDGYTPLPDRKHILRNRLCECWVSRPYEQHDVKVQPVRTWTKTPTFKTHVNRGPVYFINDFTTLQLKAKEASAYHTGNEGCKFFLQYVQTAIIISKAVTAV